MFSKKHKKRESVQPLDLLKHQDELLGSFHSAPSFLSSLISLLTLLSCKTPTQFDAQTAFHKSKYRQQRILISRGELILIAAQHLTFSQSHLLPRPIPHGRGYISNPQASPSACLIMNAGYDFCVSDLNFESINFPLRFEQF